jgi:hypothetical protein
MLSKSEKICKKLADMEPIEELVLSYWQGADAGKNSNANTVFSIRSLGFR